MREEGVESTSQEKVCLISTINTQRISRFAMPYYPICPRRRSFVPFNSESRLDLLHRALLQRCDLGLVSAD